jgi:hypothetical protein
MPVGVMTLDGQQVFDDYAERYDAWYDNPNGQALLATEVGVHPTPG